MSKKDAFQIPDGVDKATYFKMREYAVQLSEEGYGETEQILDNLLTISRIGDNPSLTTTKKQTGRMAYRGYYDPLFNKIALPLYSQAAQSGFRSDMDFLSNIPKPKTKKEAKDYVEFIGRAFNDLREETNKENSNTLMAEQAHSVQSFGPRQLGERFEYIGGKAYDKKAYNDVNHIEFEAHGIIEPAIKQFVRGEITEADLLQVIRKADHSPAEVKNMYDLADYYGINLNEFLNVGDVTSSQDRTWHNLQSREHLTTQEKASFKKEVASKRIKDKTINVDPTILNGGVVPAEPLYRGGGPLKDRSKYNRHDSEYYRLYTHAKNYSQGNILPPGSIINPNGKLIIPGGQAQEAVPESPFNVQRFLYSPFILGEGQGVHDSIYDQNGQIVGNSGAVPKDSTKRERFKDVKEDLRKYYASDPNLTNAQVRKNIRNKMHLLRKMHRVDKKLGDYTLRDAEKNPDVIFNEANGAESRYVGRWKQEPLTPRRAKRAYAKYNKLFKQEYRTGGPISPEQSAINTVMTQRYRNLLWVQRGLNPDMFPYLVNEKGDRETHVLAYATGENGTAIVYPRVIMKDGTLHKMGEQEAMDYAKTTQTYIPFPTVETAKQYSENGLIKHFETREDMKKKYADGGPIKGSKTKGRPQFTMRKPPAIPPKLPSAIYEKEPFVRVNPNGLQMPPPIKVPPTEEGAYYTLVGLGKKFNRRTDSVLANNPMKNELDTVPEYYKNPTGPLDYAKFIGREYFWPGHIRKGNPSKTGSNTVVYKGQRQDLRDAQKSLTPPSDYASPVTGPIPGNAFSFKNGGMVPQYMDGGLMGNVAMGALSGAATGSAIPGWGTAVGAVVGAGSALFKGLRDQKASQELEQPVMPTTSVAASTTLREGGVPANAEVEGGEARFKLVNGKWTMVEEYKGPSHEKGGIPIQGQPGDLIGTAKDKRLFLLNKSNGNHRDNDRLMKNIQARKPAYKLYGGGPGGPGSGTPKIDYEQQVFPNIGPINNMGGNPYPNAPRSYSDINFNGNPNVGPYQGSFSMQYPYQQPMGPNNSPNAFNPILAGPANNPDPNANTGASKTDPAGLSTDGYMWLDKMIGASKPKAGELALTMAGPLASLGYAAFAKNKTPQATKIGRQAIHMMPSRYSINAQLAQNAVDAAGARKAIGNTGAPIGAQYKALTNKMLANNQLYDMKYNKENAMRAAKAQMQFQADNIDAQYANQYREDQMAFQGWRNNAMMSGLLGALGQGAQLMTDSRRGALDALTAGMVADSAAGGTGIDLRNLSNFEWINKMFGPKKQK